MALMPVTDAMFLVGERREQPMHVGGLQLFTPPEDAGPDFLPLLHRQALDITNVAPLFRKRAYRSLTTLGQWHWVDDDQLDLEHHLRHSALPRPGRVRELLALTSRLHGTLLDRERPLWEVHLIEGLEGGRFAMYTKTHHAMMDGVSALRLLERSLSAEPDNETPLPWEAQERSSDGSSSGGLRTLPQTVWRTAADVAGLGPAMLRIADQALRDHAAVLPLQAPRTMFNTAITGSRRFAADDWPMDKLQAVGRAAGATVNDVVLAMCSGALRRYLMDLDALPDDPLIAMTPVSLRKDPDDSASGNAVGTLLCNLATDVADPVERLLAISSSMQRGKAALSGLSQLQVTALSAAIMTPLVFTAFLGLHRLAPPPYNLVISNVPGPRRPLYFRGARMQGIYPLSIPLDGQALNITVTSYNGQMEFGLIGCRRRVPRLQRLLGHLNDSLEAMADALV